MTAAGGAAWLFLQYNKHLNVIGEEVRNSFQVEAGSDTKIRCEGGTINVHRLILASASPWLKTIFDEVEPVLDTYTIVIPEVKYQDMLLLVRFIYGGEVTVPLKQLGTLQDLIQLLQLDPGQGNNGKFLVENIQDKSITVPGGTKVTVVGPPSGGGPSNSNNNVVVPIPIQVPVAPANVMAIMSSGSDSDIGSGSMPTHDLRGNYLDHDSRSNQMGGDASEPENLSMGSTEIRVKAEVDFPTILGLDSGDRMDESNSDEPLFTSTMTHEEPLDRSSSVLARLNAAVSESQHGQDQDIDVDVVGDIDQDVDVDGDLNENTLKLNNITHTHTPGLNSDGSSQESMGQQTEKRRKLFRSAHLNATPNNNTGGATRRERNKNNNGNVSAGSDGGRLSISGGGGGKSNKQRPFNVNHAAEGGGGTSSPGLNNNNVSNNNNNNHEKSSSPLPPKRTRSVTNAMAKQGSHSNTTSPTGGMETKEKAGSSSSGSPNSSSVALLAKVGTKITNTRTKTPHLQIIPESGVLRCSMCHYECASYDDYKKHEKVHQPNFSCQYCGKGFFIKWNLIAHLRTHTGEKPFTCFFCNGSFRQKAHLIKHISSVHRYEGDKKMKMETAVKGKSATSGNVSDSAESPAAGGKEDFNCCFCGEPFEDKDGIRRHISQFHRDLLTRSQ